MRARAFIAALAAAAAMLVIAGCGGDNTAGSSPGGTPEPGSEQQIQDHNQADVAFAQGMIPHHAQAIFMARLAVDRAQSPQVKDLASRIELAQGPEIETMTAWLRNWNAEIPSTAESGDHSSMGPMSGMMDSQQMQQFGQATGADFDLMFLQMMIKHHEGAIAMARTELADGQYPAATQLAQQIIDAQQAEIAEMQTLLPQG